MSEFTDDLDLRSLASAYYKEWLQTLSEDVLIDMLTSLAQHGWYTGKAYSSSSTSSVNGVAQKFYKMDLKFIRRYIESCDRERRVKLVEKLDEKPKEDDD